MVVGISCPASEPARPSPHRTAEPTAEKLRQPTPRRWGWGIPLKKRKAARANENYARARRCQLRHANFAGVRRQRSSQPSLPVHHSGSGTLDQAVAPVAGETESGCGLWLGKPELGERGNIGRTEPMGRALLINSPPTSTIRSLGPVNFHGFSLPRFGKGGEQIQLSRPKSLSKPVVNRRATQGTHPARQLSTASGHPPACRE